MMSLRLENLLDLVKVYNCLVLELFVGLLWI